MDRRRLGRTGHESTIVCFGTAALGRETITQAEADKAVELVLGHGVNQVDIAPTYGQAMERLSPWMPRMRAKVFLGGKTRERTRDAAWRNIHECMRRLGVDRFDLFQLHAVITMEELDAVTAPGGALEALVEMRDQGLTRWLGITGHGPLVPRVHLEALRRFDFDTVMFPVGAAIFRNADYRRDAEALMAAAAEKDVGVQVIKSLARGGWGDAAHDRDTWYDPHRDQAEVDRAVWWTLSQAVHTAPSAGDVVLLPRVLDAAERFRRLTAEEQAAVLAGQPVPRPEPALGILPRGA